jgi:polyhydroxyalkanoate synthesis regulator phasin
MKSILKDIAVLLFAAGDEIESKAKEFKEERETRFKEFEEKLKEKKDNFMSNTGFASKEDISTLMDKIDELNAKIDSIKK